jgi:hypothetical protein
MIRLETVAFSGLAFIFIGLAAQAVPWWMLLPFLLWIASMISVAIDTNRPDKPLRLRPDEHERSDFNDPYWW